MPPISPIQAWPEPSNTWGGYSHHYGPHLHGQHPVSRTLGNAIDWTKLPPGLGFADTVTYHHGVPSRDYKGSLLENWARLGGLGAGYTMLHGILPWWVIPLWSGILGANEARRSNDPLSNIQNVIQVTVPLLAGTYLGQPLGNMARAALEDKENKAIRELLEVSPQEDVLKELVNEQQNQINKQLNETFQQRRKDIIERYRLSAVRRSGGSTLNTRESENRKRELDRLDDWLDREKQSPKNNLKRDSLAKLESKWKEFVKEYKKHELYELPYKRKELVNLHGELTRQAHRIDTESDQQIRSLLDRAINLMPEETNTVSDPYRLFNQPEAKKLLEEVRTARKDVLHKKKSPLPESLRAELDRSLDWVTQRIGTSANPGTPTKDMRQWFHKKGLEKRFGTLARLKAELHDELKQFDRETVEIAFKKAEGTIKRKMDPKFKGYEVEEFQRVVRNFKVLKETLHASQEFFPQVLKKAGPWVGFVLVGSALAYPLVYAVNSTLQKAFPRAAYRPSPNPFAPYRTMSSYGSAGRTEQPMTPWQYFNQPGDSKNYISWFLGAPHTGGQPYPYHPVP